MSFIFSIMIMKCDIMPIFLLQKCLFVNNFHSLSHQQQTTSFHQFSMSQLIRIHSEYASYSHQFV